MTTTIGKTLFSYSSMASIDFTNKVKSWYRFTNSTTKYRTNSIYRQFRLTNLIETRRQRYKSFSCIQISSMSSSNTINQISMQEPVDAKQFAENANRRHRVAWSAMNHVKDTLATHDILIFTKTLTFYSKRRLICAKVL